MASAPELLVHGVPVDSVSERAGSLAQVARVDSFSVDNGPARGSRRIRMVTGGGLDVELLPDRALDIGHVSYNGTPLAWISAVGMTSPHSYETHGTEWLRSFGGGLLATCGLDTFGPFSEDEGREFPMHGRIGQIPATMTRSDVDGVTLAVCGEVRQAKVFGENLVLRRSITADVGGSTLRIRDTVTNESQFSSGHMILYHFNLGWPLLHEGARLEIPSTGVSPRDDDAVAGVEHCRTIEPPTRGFREQVYLHEFTEDIVRVAVDNPHENVRLELSFPRAQLPGLFQWKMCDAGHYVMGLEPTNVGHVFGRESARSKGVLPRLESGESASYGIDITVSESHS